jgi:hypothetical protein
MAFSDEAIRAIVGTGEFADGHASALLTEVLIKRRDRIGQAYLPRINPVIDPRLESTGVLSFANAAVDHRVATPPTEYVGSWYAFDNATDTARPIGETTAVEPRLPAPPGLPTMLGGYVRVDISAKHPDHSSWVQPVEAHFRRDATGWTLVGLERRPRPK